MSTPAAMTWPAAGKELAIFGGSVLGMTVTGATVLGGIAASGLGAASAELAKKAANARRVAGIESGRRLVQGQYAWLDGQGAR